MALFSGETSYGFIPEVVDHMISPDLQPCFRTNHFAAHLGSQIPDLNLNKQTFEEFSKLEPNADGRRDSTNQFDQVFSPPLDMPSALSSDTFYRMWDCKTQSLNFSPAEPQKDENHDLDENPDWEDSVDEDVPDVTFRTKFFDFLPLYQNYLLETVRDEVHKLKDNVSELIKPQSVNRLEGIRLSESEPLKSPEFESLQSTLSPRSRLQDSLLEELTLPSPPSQSKVSSCTLWQDLEEVKNSNLLSILTPKEISLQETMFELMSSEASYLKSLGVLINHFYGSKALKKTVSRVEHGIVFSNVCQVMAVSARFLQDLETRLEENMFISEVGDIVLRHCKEFRQAYTTYVTTSTYQTSLVNQLLEQNQSFAHVLKKLENDPVCQRQSFKSFLILPFQRITRIKLLLETIQKQTRPNCNAALNLDKAINVLHEILMYCDKKTQKMKQIEELICLEMLMDFNDIKSIPLVISTRFLIRQGPLKQLNIEGTHSQRRSFIKIYLHLFNDLLIISSKKYQRFMVVDHTRFPAHVTVESLKPEALGLSPDSFLLHLSQSQRGRATAMVLVALSKSDKETWMKALSSK